MPARHAPIWLTGLAIAVACSGLLVFGVRALLIELSWGYFNDRAFNQKQWKDGTVWAEDPLTFKAPLRGQMAADLMGRYLRRGMTQSEVNDLLGPPDTDHKTKSEWEYYVGNYSGFRVDGDFLTIQFDEEGRVLDFWLWQS